MANTTQMLHGSVVSLLGFFLVTSGSNGQEKGVEAVKPLLVRFPHRAQAGPVTVYSDISKKFSEEHAKHAEKVYPKTYGLVSAQVLSGPASLQGIR